MKLTLSFMSVLMLYTGAIMAAAPYLDLMAGEDDCLDFMPASRTEGNISARLKKTDIQRSLKLGLNAPSTVKGSLSYWVSRADCSNWANDQRHLACQGKSDRLVLRLESAGGGADPNLLDESLQYLQNNRVCDLDHLLR
jgi:hypothetical protein